METYIQYTFKPCDTLEQETLIALLSSIGFTGFEQQHEVLIASIPESQFRDKDFHLVIPSTATYKKEHIKPTNWNQQWEQSFQPVIIDEYCAIRAYFHEPVPNVEHDIIITPKMSFGTGHHATTFLVIQLMKNISFKNMSVLDFGTGTGVLAILAEKEGALEIDAIDNDEWSISNAQENILANTCTRIHLKQASGIEAGNLYDVILANINKHVILANMSEVKQHLKKDGVVVFSGLLSGDELAISEAGADHGLVIVNLELKQSWIALVLKHSIDF